MIQVRDALPEDASAIADLLGELGYPASAAEIPARLDAVAEVPGRVLVAAAEQHAAAWGCETLELTSRDERHQTHRFYVGLGFESGSRKFVRPVAV
jgi:GNAT superfamily N-acetyltransferase